MVFDKYSPNFRDASPFQLERIRWLLGQINRFRWGELLVNGVFSGFSGLLLWVKRLIEVAKFKGTLGIGKSVNVADVRVQVLFKNPNPPRNQVCFFSHFDPDCLVSLNTIEYVRNLDDIGFSVLFCTTSPSLTEPALAELRSICQSIVLRENIGFDFGSWKVLIDLHPEIGSQSDELVLLANDSVLGPLHSISDILENFRSSQHQVLGLTESLLPVPHIQSYFLCLKHSVVESMGWQRFWSSEVFKFFEKKSMVVFRQEVCLGNWLLKTFDTKIMCPYSKLVELAPMRNPYPNICPLNPTVFYWDVLLKKMKFPFLKFEVCDRWLEGRDRWKHFGLDESRRNLESELSK